MKLIGTIVATVFGIMIGCSLIINHGANARGLLFAGSQTTASSSYTGPCDVVACTGPWYGLRGASAAAANGTTKAIRLKRTSDSTTQDIVVLTTGALDVATATTFCNATTCQATIAYDQSGSNLCSSAPCDLSTSTDLASPLFVLNCIGSSLPCLRGVGNGENFSVETNTLSIAVPLTTYSVCDRTADFTTYQACSGTHADQIYIGMLNATNTARFADAGAEIDAAASDNVCHVILGLETSLGTSSILAVDNVETSGTMTAAQSLVADKLVIMAHGSGPSSALEGNWFETGWWGSALSSGNRTAIRSNASTYWSCLGV